MAPAVLSLAGADAAYGQGLLGGRVRTQLSAAATYDSNVARGNSVVANARSLRPGEFTYSPNANIDASFPFGRQALFLSGDVGYVFHQYNKDLQSERIALSGGGRTGLGPCGLSVTGSVSKGQSELADLDLSVTRNNQQTTSVATNASCNPTSGIGVSAGYNYSETRNTSDLRVQNSHNQGVNGGLTYSTRLLGTVSLSGGYSKSGYDNVDPTNPFAPRGFKQSNVSLSVGRPIGTRLTGQASVGYTNQNSSGVGQGFSGFTGSGALIYRVNPRLVANLGYQRSAQTSVQQGANFVVSQSANLSFNYRLSTRVNANIGGRASRRSYRGQTVISPTSLIRDEAYGVSSGVSLAVGRQSSVSLNASYDVRNANPSLYDYSAYRVGVSVATSF